MSPLRRVQGTGGLHKIKDARGRVYYRASVELDPLPDGRRRRKTFTSRSRATAAQMLQDWISGVTPPRALRLGDWLTEWLAGRDGVRDSTIERYRQAIRRLPADLLAQELAKVTPEHLEACYRTLRSEGMAPAGVLKVHRVLHSALARAERREYVKRNVAALVDAPRVPRTEVRTISAQQVLQLLDAARGDRFEALYVLAVSTGMRQGELLALRWQDVDLDAPSVMVRGSLRRRGTTGLHRQETKTGHERRLDIAPTVADSLRGHRTHQLEERLHAGDTWQDHGLVFPLPDGRPCAHSWFLRSSWNLLRERCGIGPMPFKDATRHAAASLLLAGGVQLKVVQEVLGHSTIATTGNTYSHVLPGMQREAVATMERLLRSRAQ